MRVLALLLIFANLCFWFWARYIDAPAEPSAMASPTPQHTPLPLLLASERQADKQAAAASALTCLSVGPFQTEAQSTATAKRLNSAGVTSTPRIEAAELFAGYWVSLSGYSQRADAEKTLARLHVAGISDAYLLNEDAEPNVISLGLFTERSNAEQRRDAITQLGLNPQLRTRTRKGDTYWLDIALQEPGQHIDPTLLQPESAGITRLETRPCPSTASK